jgi:hypothetical protein
MRTSVSLLVALLVVAGCTTSQPSVQPTTGPTAALPTHKGLSGGPAALLTATLVADGGCVYASSTDPTGRWLPIWPLGFQLDGQSIKNGSDVVAVISGVVKLGGGEYHASQVDFFRTLLTSPIPDACQSDEYWLVTEVIP